ncbi:hypothetical protein AB4525_08405 [Vibrio breoganii]
MKKIAVLALGTVLIGCGSDSKDSNEPTSPDNIAQLVRCSNQAEGGLCQDEYSGTAWSQVWHGEEEFRCTWGIYCFDDYQEAPEVPALTRFVEGELIPVYFREKEDDRFTKAMDQIEDLVGFKMFNRMGVVDIHIPEYGADTDVSHLPTEWGFILSQGTVGPSPIQFCVRGTVAAGPYINSASSYIVSHSDFGIMRPALSYGANQNFSWINLDSVEGARDDIRCSSTATQDVAIHEFGHALGMRNHFDGFGVGPAWGKNAERVLKTMYSKQNPPGQPFDSLHIED